jgi:hypothetical protein
MGGNLDGESGWDAKIRRGGGKLLRPGCTTANGTSEIGFLDV